MSHHAPLNEDIIPGSDASRDLSDETLMALIQKQDQNAFAILLQRHSDRFYSLAYRTLFSQSDAEDVVQECFLKLWRKPDIWKADSKATFTTWFYRIIINACIDKNRQTKPVTPYDEVEILDENSDSFERLSSQQQEDIRQKRLTLALQKLPERQRTALNLCFYEGLKNQAAAEVMDINLKALQSLLMRAKTSLKNDLAKTQGET